jgi:hypothetical protein
VTFSCESEWLHDIARARQELAVPPDTSLIAGKGRLGKNAEVKTTQNKEDCAVLSIATSESWNKGKG